MAPAQQTFPLPGPGQGNGAAAVALAPQPAPAPAPAPAPVTPAGESVPGPAAPAKKASARNAPARKKAPAKPSAKKPAPAGKRPPAKKKGRWGWLRVPRVGEDQVFTAAGYAVAVTAVVVSYSHMYEVAHLAGQEWRSWLLPVSVDALALVSSMTVRRCRRLGAKPGVLVWAALALSVAASLAANVAAANPDVIVVENLRWAVGAWPPVAFLLAELVIQRWHRAAKEAAGPGALEPLDKRPTTTVGA